MASSAPRSLFSYNITRSYPFRWFTPVTLLGALIATALFTYVNFAASAYQLQVETSFDPTATLANDALEHWPSLISTKLKPSCQPLYFPVGSQVFTNNTALTYTISGIFRNIDNMTSDEGSSDSNGVIILQALGYLANVLEHCSINSIEMDLSAMDRTANQFAYSEWGAVVRSYITCYVLWDGKYDYFNMTQTYDYVPDTVTFRDVSSFLGTNFLDRNSQTKASLWWGESLMSTYWALMTRSMQDIRANQTSAGQPGIRKGTISFTPSDSITDISDPAFFDIDYRFIVDLGYGSFDVIFPGDNNYNTTVENLQLFQQYPNIWQEADALAKSAWSTILIDLGPGQAKSNILTNSTLLQQFTLPFPTASQYIANAWPGPATLDYDSLKSTTGTLGVSRSVIAAVYLCEIPQLKSAGNIIIALIVADFVFLSVTWAVFRKLVEWILLRPQARTMLCAGCTDGMLLDRRNLENYTSPRNEYLGGEGDGQHELQALRTRNVLKKPPPHSRSSSTAHLISDNEPNENALE